MLKKNSLEAKLALDTGLELAMSAASRPGFISLVLQWHGAENW